ncbi:hypothetical protein ACFYPA_06100 [Streptomyces sp. NPDC005775]|uniref:hypothetical protein n=1 Tax=Streptomyces sp. NPDC005775 TaxID=3364729 RepID=UPI00369180FF
MARLQILELPEGSGDDRPPFVLVIDQYEGVEVPPGAAQESRLLRYQGMAEQIGARAVLIFDDTINIPANEITLSDATDGNVIRIRVEPDLDGFTETVMTEVAKAQAEVIAARQQGGLR